jgi:phage-related protein
LPHGRIARVLFCVEQGCMVLLHGFMKKTQKTPQQDIDLAMRRKKGTGS